ncbi:ABC transporter substrate-binding protein [Cupriavidus necator]|uniref:Amino acid/amide ABC transporter substrate-binding protein, HAAT family n=1 Tax=Cupriavidus pinatubonensis (strain JMP 134 / LMG 1197) TaxID=264198 RepID=Q473N4_CUPPJ|nr:ABC transporter substrate-binding protein [Cupriavidus necator]
MDRRQFVWAAAALGGAAAVARGARAAGAAPGIYPDRIVFGQTIGFDSVWGGPYRSYTEGLLTYFNHVNAKSGVHGRRLIVKRREDNYVPEKTVANVQAFLQDEVFGLVCMAGTGNTLAALPLIAQHRLPVVGTFTGAPDVRRDAAPLFHTRGGYVDEVMRMVQHAATIGLKRIAVVYQDNAFGKVNADAAVDAARKYGAEIATMVVHSVKGDDVAAVVAKLQGARAQTTLLFTAPQSVADILTAHQSRHGPLPYPWILSVTSARQVFEKAGDLSRGVAVTQIMPNPASRVVPLVREFQDVLDQAGVSDNRTYEAVEGFVTAKVVVEGLLACGTNPSRELFISKLEAFGKREFGGLRVHYDRNRHSGPDYVEIAMIGNGGRIIS